MAMRGVYAHDGLRLTNALVLGNVAGDYGQVYVASGADVQNPVNHLR